MIINAEKWKHQVSSQHRVGAPDLTWEIREGFSEKLQSKDEKEGTQEDEEERSRQELCGEFGRLEGRVVGA